MERVEGIKDAIGNPRGYAYVPKESFVAEGMRNLFRFRSSGITRETVVRVTLRLEVTGPKRFIVTEIVSGSWMVL